MPSEPNEPQVQDLLLLGTSMGEARPKAVIQNQGELWIAKFAHPDDRWNLYRSLNEPVASLFGQSICLRRHGKVFLH